MSALSLQYKGMKTFAVEFPDEARLWVYPALPLPSEQTLRRLHDSLDAFLADWRSHEQSLKAAWCFREPGFVLVACDNSVVAPSGCAQDALRHAIEKIELDLGLNLSRAPAVIYRDATGSVQTLERADFIKRLKRGSEFAPETPVFDTTLTTLGELRRLGLERPLRQSWHGQLYERHARAAQAGVG